MNKNVVKLFFLLILSVAFSIAVYQFQKTGTLKIYENYIHESEQAIYKSGFKECVRELQNSLMQGDFLADGESGVSVVPVAYFYLIKLGWPIILLLGLFFISLFGIKWLNLNKNT